MQKLFTIVLITGCAFFFSCGSKYSKLKIKDKNATSEHVYGEIGGPSRHSKNTYPPAKPETVEKAAKFRAFVESQLVSGN